MEDFNVIANRENALYSSFMPALLGCFIYNNKTNFRFKLLWGYDSDFLNNQNNFSHLLKLSDNDYFLYSNFEGLVYLLMVLDHTLR